MRMEGLEPPCLAALDPKSSASTNFATSAYADDSATIPIAIGIATVRIKLLPSFRDLRITECKEKKFFIHQWIFFIYFVLTEMSKSFNRYN